MDSWVNTNIKLHKKDRIGVVGIWARLFGLIANQSLMIIQCQILFMNMIFKWMVCSQP